MERAACQSRLRLSCAYCCAVEELIVSRDRRHTIQLFRLQWSVERPRSQRGRSRRFDSIHFISHFHLISPQFLLFCFVALIIGIIARHSCTKVSCETFSRSSFVLCTLSLLVLVLVLVGLFTMNLGQQLNRPTAPALLEEPFVCEGAGESEPDYISGSK